MINIIRKRVKSSESAAEEFHQAKREDLEQKEAKQIAVLEDYLPTNSMGEVEITKAIQEAVDKMRTSGKNISQGMVMKVLVGPDGILDGQNVDKKDIARLVNGLI